MIHERQLRSSCIAAIAAMLLLPACASASTPKVTTTLRVAVTGSFFFDTGDQSSSEWIDCSGDVQLVVQAIPPSNPILPVNFTVQVDENGAATSALANIGKCRSDFSCGN
jgi:hypothetical protein